MNENVSVWDFLSDCRRPIVIYGTGNGADKIMNVLDERQIPVQAVFASNGFVRKRIFRSFEVCSFENVKKEFSNPVILFSFGSERPEVLDYLKILNREYTVLAPEVPLFGGELIDKAFFERHKEKIEAAKEALYDEKSKEVFDAICDSKLSGKIDYLFNCETSREDDLKSIFKFSDGENYLDVGAYRGDTVEEFIRFCPNYGEITALEPDKKNYKKLLEAEKSLKRFTAINAAAFSECREIGFSGSGGRQSAIGDGEKVQAITVDSLNKYFHYMKIDAEGSDEAVLKGAEQMLKEKPKVLLSVYHRSEDFFEFPLYLKSVRSDYKIAFRHQSYVPAWDTCIYCS